MLRGRSPMLWGKDVDFVWSLHVSRAVSLPKVGASQLHLNGFFALAHDTFSGDEVDPMAAALAAKATVTVPAARAIVSFSRCAIFCSGELSSVSLSTALYLEGPALNYKHAHQCLILQEQIDWLGLPSCSFLKANHSYTCRHFCPECA